VGNARLRTGLIGVIGPENFRNCLRVCSDPQRPVVFDQSPQFLRSDVKPKAGNLGRCSRVASPSLDILFCGCMPPHRELNTEGFERNRDVSPTILLSLPKQLLRAVMKIGVVVLILILSISHPATAQQTGSVCIPARADGHGLH
jgi:hypothetical protein